MSIKFLFLKNIFHFLNQMFKLVFPGITQLVKFHALLPTAQYIFKILLGNAATHCCLLLRQFSASKALLIFCFSLLGKKTKNKPPT